MDNNKKVSDKKYTLYVILMFVITILMYFLTIVHRNSSGVLHDYLQQDFSMTALQFSNFSSMYFYPYVIMQLPMGIFADTIGPRKALTIGCATSALGTFIFCNAKTFSILCLGRALIGIGVSSPMVCCQKLYANWFSKKKVATATGFSQGISSMLAMLGQAPLAIIVGIMTWRSVYTAITIGTVILAVLLFIVIRDFPEDMGFPASEVNSSVQSKKLPSGKELKTSIASVICNKKVLPLLIMMPIMMGTFNMFISTWGISYISDTYGLSAVDASKYTTVIMIGVTVGCLVLPTLSDRMGKRKPILYALSIVNLVIWVLLTYGTKLVDRFNLLTVLMICLGFTQGSIPIFFAVLREVNKPELAGMAVGFPNTIGMGGSPVMALIAGALINNRIMQNAVGLTIYKSAFALCVVLSVIQLVANIFVTETNCENINLKMSK